MASLDEQVNEVGRSRGRPFTTVSLLTCYKKPKKILQKKPNHKRKFSVFMVGERSKIIFLSLANNRRM